MLISEEVTAEIQGELTDQGCCGTMSSRPCKKILLESTHQFSINKFELWSDFRRKKQKKALSLSRPSHAPIRSRISFVSPVPVLRQHVLRRGNPNPGVE